MTASYFRTLAARCRTASRDPFDLFAKEEFRQPARGRAPELERAAVQADEAAV
jgi:hypothetical protein